MAQLVDHEVLVEHRALQQDQVPRGVSAEAAEARDSEQPGGDDDPDAAQVDRLGIELEPVEPGLRAFEQLAPIQMRRLRVGWNLLEDENDEQDQDEDRCADADVHVLPLVWFRSTYPTDGSKMHHSS